VSADRVNRLIGRLFSEPGLLARLQSDREGLFSETGLSETERAALRDGSPPALERVGVNPILRMHYLMATKPELAASVTVRDFLPDLMKERRNG
jgi:hypothetical protein